MKKRNFNIPVRYLIFILAFVCVGLMAASYLSPSFSRIITDAGYRVLAPMQRTLNAAGSRLAGTFSELSTISSIREENAELRARVEALEEENRLLYQNIYELRELRELYGLSLDYTQYDTIGAQVVQRSTGNWYNEFTINKGTADGVYTGANVLADGALCGRVTYAGEHYSRVLAIIDDMSNVGGVTMPGGAYCVVSGDLELYSEGLLRLGYVDADAVIGDGDLVVTSNTSSTYFPGIAIGYAQDVEISPNNVIQSGYITPIADFSDLDAVLVIVTPFTESAMSDEQMASAAAEAASEAETETGGDVSSETAPETAGR